MKKTFLEHMSQFEFELLLKIKNSFGNYSTSWKYKFYYGIRATVINKNYIRTFILI